MNEPSTAMLQRPEIRPLPGSIAVVAFTVLLLGPVINKPFHIDDTLFVRLAQQIQERPFAPFDFEYNWFGKVETFWTVTQNPPLNGYLIAAVATLAGMQELPLHAAFMGMAIGCSLLMYALARRMCDRPALVTMLSLLAPAFSITASSVMADVPMYLFWLIAVWAAVRYVETLQPWALWIVSLAATAAAMTKYFGIAVLPLVAIYVIPRDHRSMGHLLTLFIPIIALLAWGGYAELQSEIFHPLGAAQYATDAIAFSGQGRLQALVHQTAYALAFLGGSMLWPIFSILMLYKLPKWSILAVGIVLGFLVWQRQSLLGVFIEQGQLGSGTWQVLVPFLAMATAGTMVIVVAGMAWFSDRSAETTLLGLWFFGTLVFAAYLNWSVNARVILPAVFPATLLFFRWVSLQSSAKSWIRFSRVIAAPAAAISVLVSLADFEFAKAGRDFAQGPVREYVAAGERVLFSGHWGFQYYMEEEGAQCIDFDTDVVASGDLVVYPDHNTNVHFLDLPVSAVKAAARPNKYGIHTMAVEAGCGFYSSRAGPVPFNLASKTPADAFVVERHTGATTRAKMVSE